MNFGLTGKGNTSSREGLDEMVKAGCVGLKAYFLLTNFSCMKIGGQRPPRLIRVCEFAMSMIYKRRSTLTH
jgi:urease alpha subunit